MSVYVILPREELTNELLTASEYTRASDVPMSLDKSKGVLRFNGAEDFPLSLHTRDIKIYNESEMVSILQGAEWTPVIPE